MSVRNITKLYKELTEYLVVEDAELRKVRYIALATGVARSSESYTKVDIITLVNRLSVYVMIEPDMLINELRRAFDIKHAGTNLNPYASTFIEVITSDRFYTVATLKLLDDNIGSVNIGTALGARCVSEITL